jgi:hypothetical protein
MKNMPKEIWAGPLMWRFKPDGSGVKYIRADTLDAHAQCCMCGKTGLSTNEDGGPECELSDGRWVCGSDCWEVACDPDAQLSAFQVLSARKSKE